MSRPRGRPVHFEPFAACSASDALKTIARRDRRCVRPVQDKPNPRSFDRVRSDKRSCRTKTAWRLFEACGAAHPQLHDRRKRVRRCSCSVYSNAERQILTAFPPSRRSREMWNERRKFTIASAILCQPGSAVRAVREQVAHGRGRQHFRHLHPDFVMLQK